jgi:acetyl esterase/lipase
VQWLGNQPNRAELAKAASPLTYVKSGMPPTIMIHGDADNLVPYLHSIKLRDALQQAGGSRARYLITGANDNATPPLIVRPAPFSSRVLIVRPIDPNTLTFGAAA